MTMPRASPAGGEADPFRLAICGCTLHEDTVLLNGAREVPPAWEPGRSATGSPAVSAGIAGYRLTPAGFRRILADERCCYGMGRCRSAEGSGREAALPFT